MNVNKFGWNFCKKYEYCKQYPEKRTLKVNKDQNEVIFEDKQGVVVNAEFLTESCLAESIITVR